MARVKANGIEIEYEATGNKADPALLLVMGLGAQLTIWPDALFEGLAKRGFYVIRFDNRDTGLSTDFGAWGAANIPAALQKVMKGEKVAAPYYLRDMAADAIGQRWQSIDCSQQVRGANKRADEECKPSNKQNDPFWSPHGQILRQVEGSFEPGLGYFLKVCFEQP